MAAFRAMCAAAVALFLIPYASCTEDDDFGQTYGPANYSCSIDSQKILIAMNDARELHNAPILQWNASLASAARREANKLKRRGDCRIPLYYRDEEGTNYLATHARNFSEELAVRFWYEGSADYDFKEGGPLSRNPNALAFSQLVWRSTKEVGCGISCCGDKNLVLVCRFSPAGNVQGYFTQNVKEKLGGHKEMYDEEKLEL